MQPLRQFQGAPTSAMNFPMEAYMNAINSASKAMLAGSSAMGEGISQGIKSVGEAYGDYKKMESDVKASASFVKSIADLMPESEAKNHILDQINKTTTDPNLSLRQKFDYANNVKQLIGNMLGQQYKMEQIGAEIQPKIAAAQAELNQRNQTQSVFNAFNQHASGWGEKVNKAVFEVLGPSKWGKSWSDIVETPESASQQEQDDFTRMKTLEQRAKAAKTQKLDVGNILGR